jgi:hypothetical protein
MADGGSDLAIDAVSVGLHDLEPDALRVLGCIADRLRFGRKCYGDMHIATDRRNARKERGEELADALVYTAYGILKGEIDAERRVDELLAKCTEQRNEIVALKERVRALTAENTTLTALLEAVDERMAGA